MPQEDRGVGFPGDWLRWRFQHAYSECIVAPNPNERWNWSRRSRPSRTAHRNTHAISTAPLPDSRRIFCFVRIMRISVALAVIGLAQCVLAEDNFPVAYSLRQKMQRAVASSFARTQRHYPLQPQWAIAETATMNLPYLSPPQA